MKRFLLALAIVLGSSQTHASPQAMTWRGPIDSAFLAAFEAQKDTIKDLFLESHGGDYQTGITVAQEVRDKGIKTHVLTYCESACSTIYQGGVKRYAKKDSVLLYHPPSLGQDVVETYLKHCSSDIGVISCPMRLAAMTAHNWDMFRQWVGLMVSLNAPNDFESLVRSQGIAEPWGIRGNFTELGQITFTGEQAAKLGLVTNLE